MPCQPFLSSSSGTPLPLIGPGQHHRGSVVAGPGLRQRLIDRHRVVTVDDERTTAEGLHPGSVAVQVPLQLRRPALAQAVDVDDGGEIAEPVVARLVEGLPDRAFGGLAVPAQDPDVIGKLVEVFPGQTDADRVGETLAEGAGGHVHPRQHRSGVTLQAGPELSVGRDELLLAHHPHGSEHRIDAVVALQRRRDARAGMGTAADTRNCAASRRCRRVHRLQLRQHCAITQGAHLNPVYSRSARIPRGWPGSPPASARLPDLRLEARRPTAASSSKSFSTQRDSGLASPSRR